MNIYTFQAYTGSGVIFMLRLIQIMAHTDRILCLMLDCSTLKTGLMDIFEVMKLIESNQVFNFQVSDDQIKCTDGSQQSIYVKYDSSLKNDQNIVKFLTGKLSVRSAGKIKKLPEFKDLKKAKECSDPQMIVHVIAKIYGTNTLICCDSTGKCFTYKSSELANTVLKQRAQGRPIKVVNGRIQDSNVQAIKGLFMTIKLKNKPNETESPKKSVSDWKYLLNYSKFVLSHRDIESGPSKIDSDFSEKFDDFYKDSKYSLMLTGNNKDLILGYMFQNSPYQRSYLENIKNYRGTTAGMFVGNRRFDYQLQKMPFKKLTQTCVSRVTQRVIHERYILAKQAEWRKHYQRLFSLVGSVANSTVIPNSAYVACLKDFIEYRIKNDEYIAEKLKPVANEVKAIINSETPIETYGRLTGEFDSWEALIALAAYIDYLTAAQHEIVDSTVLVCQSLYIRNIRIKNNEDNHLQADVKHFIDVLDKGVAEIVGFVKPENFPKYHVLGRTLEQQEILTSINNNRCSQKHYYSDRCAFKFLVDTYKGREVKKDFEINYTSKKGIRWKTKVCSDASEILIQRSDDEEVLSYQVYAQPTIDKDSVLFAKVNDNMYIIADEGTACNDTSKYGTGYRAEFRILLFVPRGKTGITDIIYLPLRMRDIFDSTNFKPFETLKSDDFCIEGHVINGKIYYVMNQGGNKYILAPQVVNFNAFDTKDDMVLQKPYSKLKIDRPLIFDSFFYKGIQTYKYRYKYLSGDISIFNNQKETPKDYYSEISIDLRNLYQRAK